MAAAYKEEFSKQRERIKQLEERNENTLKGYITRIDRLDKQLDNKLEEKDLNNASQLRDMDLKYRENLHDFRRQALEELDGRMAIYKENLDGKDYEISRLKSQNSKLVDQFKEYDGELSEKEKIIDTYTQKIKQLQDAVEAEKRLEMENEKLQADAAEVTENRKILENTFAKLKMNCREETKFLSTQVTQLDKLLSDKQEENNQLVRQLQEGSKQRVGNPAAISKKPEAFDYPRILATVDRENRELREKNQDLLDEALEMEKQLSVAQRVNKKSKERETRLRTFYDAVKNVESVEDLLKLYEETFPNENVRDGEFYFDAVAAPAINV